MKVYGSNSEYKFRGQELETAKRYTLGFLGTSVGLSAVTLGLIGGGIVLGSPTMIGLAGLLFGPAAITGIVTVASGIKSLRMYLDDRKQREGLNAPPPPGGWEEVPLAKTGILIR
jgi:hypothetical protein